MNHEARMYLSILHLFPSLHIASLSFSPSCIPFFLSILHISLENSIFRFCFLFILCTLHLFLFTPFTVSPFFSSPHAHNVSERRLYRRCILNNLKRFWGKFYFLGSTIINVNYIQTFRKYCKIWSEYFRTIWAYLKGPRDPKVRPCFSGASTSEFEEDMNTYNT